MLINSDKFDISRLVIDNVQERDIKSIFYIYDYYISNSDYIMEELPISMDVLNDQISLHKKSKLPFLVVKYNDIIVGFCFASLFNNKQGYRFAVTNSIYIDKNYVGLGAGKYLLDKLISECKANGFFQMIAMVPSTNEQSINFHLKFKFKKIGLYKNIAYKFGKWIDIVSLQLNLDTY